MFADKHRPLANIPAITARLDAATKEHAMKITDVQSLRKYAEPNPAAQNGWMRPEGAAAILEEMDAREALAFEAGKCAKEGYTFGDDGLGDHLKHASRDKPFAAAAAFQMRKANS